MFKEFLTPFASHLEFHNYFVSFFSPISPSEIKALTELGEIKFSVQYLSKKRALKVFIIKCENLSISSKDLHVNAFVKVGSTGIKHAKCQLCNIGLKSLCHFKR